MILRRFLTFKRCSGVFWCVLRCALSWVLSCSKKFLKVLRHFVMIREILTLSGVLLFVPSGSERFLNFLRSFFLCSRDVLRFSDVIWGVLMEIWKVPECSEAYCDVFWWHPEVFSLVLSCFERILSVLRCSLMFLGILRRSNSFWGNLVDYEWFYNYLFFLGFVTFSGILMSSGGHFHGFWGVVNGFPRFWGVLWCKRNFLGTRISSHGSDRHLDVWDILSSFGMCSGNLRHFHVFWVVLKDSWTFRSVIIRCEEIWGVSVGFERFI